MGNSRMTVYSRQSEGYINVRIDSKYNEITYQAKLDYSFELLDPNNIIKRFNNTAAEMLYITNIKSTEARGWGIMRFECDLYELYLGVLPTRARQAALEEAYEYGVDHHFHEDTYLRKRLKYFPDYMVWGVKLGNLETMINSSQEGGVIKL